LAKFDTISKRLENREFIESELQKIFEKNSRKYWVKLLTEADVPVAPVLNLAEAFENYGNKLVFENNGIKYIQFPVKSNLEPGVKEPAPKLGQHTREILLELGYSEEKINELAQKGVILVNKT